MHLGVDLGGWQRGLRGHVRQRGLPALGGRHLHGLAGGRIPQLQLRDEAREVRVHLQPSQQQVSSARHPRVYSTHREGQAEERLQWESASSGMWLPWLCRCQQGAFNPKPCLEAVQVQDLGAAAHGAVVGGDGGGAGVLRHHLCRVLQLGVLPAPCSRHILTLSDGRSVHVQM